MRTSRIDCGFEVKSLDDDGHIEGHGAVFGNVDFGFDRIEKGAFKEFLKSNDEPVPMLWQHMSSEPIGVWDDLKEDSKGLYMAGQINLEVQKGREARSLTKQGAISGLSIGYRAVDYHYEDEVRVLKKLELHETSLVTFPMNPAARVVSAKNMTRKELETELREQLGLTRYLASRAAWAIRDALAEEEKRDSRDDDSLDEANETAQSILQTLRGN